jgi:hypothetical protein
MSALDRTYQADIQGSPRSAATVVAPFDDAGLYVTDEAFLFRVVGLVDTDAGEMVELEDCFGLDVVQVPITEPRLLRMRVVMTAADASPGATKLERP